MYQYNYLKIIQNPTLTATLIFVFFFLTTKPTLLNYIDFILLIYYKLHIDMPI